MVIGGTILLMGIVGYYIVGHWWLLMVILLVTILLMAIGSYYIIGYFKLFS